MSSRFFVTVSNGSILNELSSAIRVVLAHPELGWPHRKAEPGDPSEPKKILKTIARRLERVLD
jgi:hypothetical protein